MDYDFVEVYRTVPGDDLGDSDPPVLRLPSVADQIGFIAPSVASTAQLSLSLDEGIFITRAHEGR